MIVFTCIARAIERFTTRTRRRRARRRARARPRAVHGRLAHATLARARAQDPRASVVALAGLGAFVPPQNTYAAVWAYPRSIMRGFVRSEDWQPTLHTTRGMREKAAWGWRHGRILTLADDPSLRIYHLGKSGPFLVRVRGHNTLPAAKMVV